MQPHRIVATFQGEIQMAENAIVFQSGPARAVADVNNRERLVAAYWPIEIAAAVLADDRLALGMVAELRVRGWHCLCRGISSDLQDEHAGQDKHQIASGK